MVSGDCQCPQVGILVSNLRSDKNNEPKNPNCVCQVCVVTDELRTKNTLSSNIIPDLDIDFYLFINNDNVSYRYITALFTSPTFISYRCETNKAQ